MIGPDHPDFEKLPRKEQARILHDHYGWTKEALEDEYGVSHTTVKRWLNPEYARRQNEKHVAWMKTPKGQAVKKRYLESEKGKAAHRKYNRERARKMRNSAGASA